MGLFTDTMKKIQLSRAKTPLERLFIEAKWDASDEDLMWYKFTEQRIGEIIQEYGYTDEGKKEVAILLHVMTFKFTDKRFVEFFSRALDGEV